ncbi:MAG: hypothetical protein HY974_03935 [Candidatus Kerfeldbacteria bacterium]|nr:hypothetical protein [Candidatus Kerfeldbacteria bacterium]
MCLPYGQTDRPTSAFVMAPRSCNRSGLRWGNWQCCAWGLLWGAPIAMMLGGDNYGLTTVIRQRLGPQKAVSFYLSA